MIDSRDLLVAMIAGSLSGVSRRRPLAKEVVGTTQPTILTRYWFRLPFLSRAAR